MITNLLTEAFFGALTGYITNDVAIKTLFKPNGIIEKNREQFTKEIAALLENKIITADDLAQIIRRDEVTEEIAQAIVKFLAEILPQNLRDKTLDDLDEGYLKNTVGQFIGQLCADGEFKAALAEVINNSISPELVDSLLIAGKRYLPKIAQEDIWSFSEDIVVLDKTAVVSLQRQLAGLVDDFIQNIRTDSPQIMSDCLAKLEIDSVCRDIWSELELHSPAEYLGLVSNDAESIKKWLSSPNVLGVINPMIDRLWQTLKESSLYVHEIASMPPIRNMLLSFLEKQWPQISQLLVAWISQNKTVLMGMLDQSIAETLQGQDTLIGMLSKIVHDFLGYDEEFSAEFCQSAQSFLVDSFTPDQLCELLLAQGTMLGDLRLAEIAPKIPFAQGRDWLIMLVAEIVAHNSHLKLMLETPIAQLCPLSAEVVAEKVRAVISENVTFDKLAQILSTALAKIVGELAEKPLAEIIPQYDEKLKAMVTELADEIKVEDLASIMTQISTEYIVAHLAKWIDDLSELPLEKIYTLFLPPDMVSRLSPGLTKDIQNRLSAQIPGKLAPLAEKSLNTLSNDDLRKLVQDFMGRELKPLNYLGALMGGTTGAILGTAVGMTMIDPFNAAYIGGKLALFGAVGYTTNCGAVKGLFWPYKPIANIHALQGVIPKRQVAFAQSLGQLFDKYVLNPEMLGYIFDLERDRLYTTIQDMLIYQTTEIKHNLADLTPILANVTMNYCTEHTLAEVLCKLNLEGISHEKLAQYTPQVLCAYVKAQKDMLLSNGAAKITAQLENFTLRDFQAEQGIQDILAKLTNHALSGDLLAFSEQLVAECAEFFNKSLVEIIPASDSVLNSYLGKFMPGLIAWLCEYLKQHLEEITTLAQKLIKSRLSMLQAFGYAAMNGDVLVGIVLENFITQKLPIFCGLKSSEIENLFGEYLSGFCRVKLADNGLYLDKDIVYLLLSAKMWQSIYGDMAEILSAKLLDMKLNDWRKFPLIEKCFDDNLQVLSLKVPLLGDILVKGVTEALLKCDYMAIWALVKPEVAFRAELAEKWNSFRMMLQQKTAAQTIAQIIPVLGDRDEIIELIQRFGHAKQMREYLDAHQVELYEIYSEYMPLICAKSSDILLNAFLANSELYTTILEKMDLAEFITAQTAALEPQELEKMVRGFGQSYFTHIQNMGWWGAVFAIPGILLDLFV